MFDILLKIILFYYSELFFMNVINLLLKPCFHPILAITLFISFVFPVFAKLAPLKVNITFINQVHKHDYYTNPLLVAPADSGVAGIELGIEDSNTTGKFLGQQFSFLTQTIPATQSSSSIMWSDYNIDNQLLLVDLDSETLQALIAHNNLLNQPALIINIANRDNTLRQHICSANLFHTTPSHAQITDALGQWLVSKRWNNILLINGDTPDDLAWINSFKRTAKRYKININTERKWTFDTDLRRTVSQDIPLFTQTARPYDVVVVADVHQQFGQYLPYNTFYPRPVIGTAGLVADTWHPSIEQWGAKQLQNRFQTLHQRYMEHADFDAYVAVRAIAYAVQQMKGINIEALATFMRSEEFQLAAYKGRKLTFRDFNGQLRMPIELTHPLGLVARAPQTGFMHPVSELDTLGFDRREVCQ